MSETQADICTDCFDHSPGDTKCLECGLEIDEYGNTEDSFRYCSFPDCGCDGARLCMAENGASGCSTILNVEKASKPLHQPAAIAEAAPVKPKFGKPRLVWSNGTFPEEKK